MGCEPRAAVALPLAHAVSARVGWARELDRNGYPQTIVRTTDGGRHWTDVGPPVRNPRNIADLFALDADRAWASASFARHRFAPVRAPHTVVVFRTSDGGKTWGRSVPFRIRGFAGEVQFVDREHGWLSIFQGVAAGSSAMTLERSVDGGHTWHPVASATPAGKATIPFGCDKGTFTFITASTGWLPGSCAGGRPFFYLTHDGGTTWRPQSLPDPRDPSRPLPACQCDVGDPAFSGRVGSALVTTYPSGTLYLTRNGGRTWSATRLPGGLLPFDAIDFVNSRDGFVVGGRRGRDLTRRDGRLFRTRDGGRTWSPVHSTVDFSRFALDFVNVKVGFAFAGARLLRTTDGGRTWRPVG